MLDEPLSTTEVMTELALQRDRAYGRIAELEGQIKEWESLQQFDRGRYELAEKLLARLAQEVIDWWPNSSPPTPIESAIREIREVYPHMAKQR